MRTARTPHVAHGLHAAIALGCALASPAAHAFTTDARRLAMGGVQLPGGRDMAAANVAYQTMPARRQGWGASIPLPLGLVRLASDFPTLDPNDPNFSATRLANLALNPPFFLELSRPSDLDGDIALRIARNEFAIDFEDARRLLPQRPIDRGGAFSRPLVGLGLMGARTYVAPLVTMEGLIALDDALYGVLTQGEPVRSNSTYGMQARGESMGGTTINLGYSDGGWGAVNGDGLYCGAYAKYIMGLGLGRADTQFSLHTSDVIFGNEPATLGYDATTRYAPFGSVGNGVGFDTGVAYRLGAIDVGVGLLDIASQVHWHRTIVQHSSLQDSVVVTDPAFTESYTYRLPTQTTLNASWSGSRTLLAADLTTSRWSTAVHFGAERRIGPMALRGGLSTDEEHRLDYAWGAGVGLWKLWLDLGFQTHHHNFTGERGLQLGTSLAIR